MSRVGKKPIPIPEKTDITYRERLVTIKGKNGMLSRSIHPSVDLQIENGYINVVLLEEAGRQNQAFQGMTRSLVTNMIHGVNSGFERVLEINGIGYRAELKGKTIVFNLGYSHPIDFELPEGVTAAIDRNHVKLSGIDNELIGRDGGGHPAAAATGTLQGKRNQIRRGSHPQESRQDRYEIKTTSDGCIAGTIRTTGYGSY